MSQEAPDTGIATEPDERTAQQYCANFDASAGTAQLLRQLLAFRGCRTPADDRAVFQGRVAHSTIRKWRTGHASIPQWAIEMLQAQTAQAAMVALRMKAGPGSKAGRRNLKRGNYPRG